MQIVFGYLMIVISETKQVVCKLSLQT